MSKKLVAVVIVGTLLVIGYAAQAGVDPVAKCISAKEKAAGLKALGLLRAFALNLKKPNADKLAADISKAQQKFTRSLVRADLQGECPFAFDVEDVELSVDGWVSEIINLINFGPTTTTTSSTSTTSTTTTTTATTTTTTAASTTSTSTTATSTTATIPTTTTTLLLCGNGVLDGDEQCDPPDYGGTSCESLGFNLGGTLDCTTACQYDVSGCECEQASAVGLLATGQTTAYQSDKNDGIPGAVNVPDDGWVEAGATLAYVDNGDGTITDLNTGLMWEKKSDDGGLHDTNNHYVWSGNGSQETIWDWLDDVNAEGGTGFAGYSDWRIPNVNELQSIIDHERYNPSVDSVFNTSCTGGCTVTTCSCTQVSEYWSSTTNADDLFSAWEVGFLNGTVSGDGKAFTNYVRAVRGGL